MSTSNPDAVHDAIQRGLSAIEDRVEGRPLDLDVDLAELTLIVSALVTIGASLVQAFNRPHGDIIEKLRLLALTAVDE